MTTKSPVGLSEPEEEKLLSMLETARRGAYVIGRPIPLLKRIVKPDLTWDAALPGLTFPYLEYTVSALHVGRFRRLLAKQGLKNGTQESTTVPPAFFADEPMQCIATLFGKSGRLHASHAMEALCSIPLGARVRSRAMITDRYERSGRQFVDVDCTVYIVDGDEEKPALRIKASLVP
ncbi:MAG: hypothetical protein ACKVQK_17340 [Burkholderiales bacterium]